jgi:uncharacterized protein (TIGR02118 family)
MIKLTFCIRRRAELSFEDFDAYWRNVHAELMRKHASDLRVQRYVQCLSIQNPDAQEIVRASRHAAASSYDGVAEIWWKSLDDLAAARRSPQGMEAARVLLEDECRFIDHASSRLWYGMEREVIG